MASTIQLSQYKSWVRSKLDDNAFDDAALTEYANEVNREICSQPVSWSFMEASTPLATSIGSNVLTGLPSNLQEAINMEITSPTASARFLNVMPYKEFCQRYPAPAALTNGTPDCWTNFGSNYLIGPAPASAVFTINLNYIKSPTATTSDSSVLDVPDDFSELVVLGMYARALEHNDQPDYAVGQYRRFQEQLSLMKQRLGSRRQSGQTLTLQNRRTLLRGR